MELKMGSSSKSEGLEILFDFFSKIL